MAIVTHVSTVPPMIPIGLYSTVVCRDASCAEAVSAPETCVCSCLSAGHGSAHRAGHLRARVAVQARADRAGGVFALIGAATTEDGPF